MQRLSLQMVICASVVLSHHSQATHYGDQNGVLETIVVTATREENSLANTAASVGILSESTIIEVNPSHSSEVLNRIPGVNIVQLGSSGEGTAAAIRQPISYGPVYLYLENGVPTRSAGFFNHNALYEMNVSGANGIEVIKGPGSALYGSDAIGAVINLLSGQPPKEQALSLGLEGGDDGWLRGQLRAATITEQHGFTARFDASSYDGWRDNTESERQSFTGSWNTGFEGDWQLNTVFTATHIDLDTGGGIPYSDYKNNPEKAGSSVGYRKVDAYRLSSSFERELATGFLSLTPFMRSNDLEYIAHWTLRGTNVASSDAHINESGHDSLGLLIKYHYDISDYSYLITGIDLDYSEGDTVQTDIDGTGPAGSIWDDYQVVGLFYDYDVDFIASSPYIHLESDLTDKWHFAAGLRYDYIRYDYSNNLSVDLTDPSHKRLPDQVVEFDHLSPKISTTYQINDKLNAYSAYRHAFRIPSAGQLFRSGENENSADLDPVTADSIELGLRGEIGERIAFDTAVYYMIKEDDIINVTDATTGGRRNVNAGETKHYGIEVGADIILSDTLDLGIAYSWSEHEYKDWVDRKGDFSGNDMPNAPDSFANIRLNYRPLVLNGGRVELEWIHQGEHYLNNANDESYSGHNLLNLRADYWASDKWNLYLRVLNATDKLYAETTNEFGKYTPGRPRSVFAGVKYVF